jgi:hypothetical protein
MDARDERELRRLIRKYPDLDQHIARLRSRPGREQGRPKGSGMFEVDTVLVPSMGYACKIMELFHGWRPFTTIRTLAGPLWDENRWAAASEEAFVRRLYGKVRAWNKSDYARVRLNVLVGLARRDPTLLLEIRKERERKAQKLREGAETPD